MLQGTTRPAQFLLAILKALHPDRVVLCKSDREVDVISAMEEILSFAGLSRASATRSVGESAEPVTSAVLTSEL